jgi:pilus assembly protein CpaB
MNRRALLLALIVGILGVILVLLYQRRFEVEASGGEKVKLLIAVKPIERGKIITDDMVATREVPQAYVEDRAIKDAEKAKILGLRVGNTVQAQQTLMWTDLITASEDRRDLSEIVQPGNRAVTIKTSREDSSVALIRPGNYVDVIAVMGAQNANTEARSAAVLLQRVLVLATGLDTSVDYDPNKKAPSYEKDNLLTLSLSLPEAQLLAAAQEKGKITVALRNPEDQRTVDRIPDYNTSLLFNRDQRDNLPGIRGGAQTTRPQPLGGNNP